MGGFVRRRGSWRSYAFLVAAIAGALAVAAMWAIRVPIFQEPDEIAHADYAFALFDVGHPFVAVDPTLTTSAAAQSRYLMDAADYRAMRYNPFARVRPGYGTRAYFRAVDAGAPARSHEPPPAHARIPYVAGLYPAGYYVLEAAAMTLAANATNGSLLRAFFAGRLLNVALLALTLVFAFAIFRRSGVPVRESILATTAVGFFPLVGWVAGYVQPDNLVACLFAAGLATALDANDRHALRNVVVAGIVVAATVLTKAHYAGALWLAIAPIVALRVPASQRKLGAFLFIAFDAIAPLVTYRLSVTTLNPVQHLVSPAAWASAAGASGSPGALPAAIFGATLHAFDDAFFGGVASLGFWLHFGIRSGTFVPDDAVGLVRDAIVALTIATIGLFVLLELNVARRIATIVRRRSLLRGARLALGAAPVNAYLIVSFMLIALGGITQGGLVLQGRYWLPVVTSLAVIVFVQLPKLAKPGPRRRIRLVVTSVAAAYSVSAAFVALAAMNANFYRPPTQPLLHESVADVDTVRIDATTLSDIDHPTVRRDETIVMSGYAVDMRTGLPARVVELSIDGREREREPVGRPVQRLATTFNDDAILRSGFEFRIPAHAVDPGTHVLRFYVAGDGNGGRLPFRREIYLRVI